MNRRLYLKRHIPWYLLAVIMLCMGWYLYKHRLNVTPTEYDNFLIATLSVLIGVSLSAILILWQRGITQQDEKHARKQELRNLIPTLMVENEINLLKLTDLMKFLKHNTQSYEATWVRINSITDQFLSNSYSAMRDARLLNELGLVEKSALASYMRLQQAQGIAREGLAIQKYDAEIRAHDRKEGNEQLQTLSSIADYCHQEMQLFNNLIKADYPD